MITAEGAMDGGVIFTPVVFDHIIFRSYGSDPGFFYFIKIEIGHYFSFGHGQKSFFPFSMRIQPVGI
jgi:hypothetical protein